MSTLRVQRLLSDMAVEGCVAGGDGFSAEGSALHSLQVNDNLGLTVRFTDLIPQTSGEGKLSDWFGRRGNFYLVTSVFDGSGQVWDHNTKVFHGIKAMEPLPLGEGGLLVAFVKNPKWFLDIHTLVMESDADVRDISSFYRQAQKNSGLLAALEGLSALLQFNPSSVLNAIQTVDVFIRMFAKMLSKNGDDVVASLHDCWLARQQFGMGRHPMRGFRHYSRMKAAYRVDIFSLDGRV